MGRENEPDVPSVFPQASGWARTQGGLVLVPSLRDYVDLGTPSDRSFGSAVQILEYRNRTRRRRCRVLSLCIGTLQSTSGDDESIGKPPELHLPNSQLHLHDDNALSVVAYALKALAVQHSTYPYLLFFFFPNRSPFSRFVLVNPCLAVVVVGHEHCGGAITAINEARRAPDPNQIKRHHTLQDSLHSIVELFHGGHNLSEVHDESSKDPNDAITRWLTPLVDRIRELIKCGKLPDDKEKALTLVVEENVKLQVDNLTSPQVRAFVKKSAKKKPVWVHGWVYDFSTGIIRHLETKVIDDCQ